DLVRVLGPQVSDPAPAVPDEEERDDLEDALAGPAFPRLGVDVARVAELAHHAALEAGLLGDLAEGGRLVRVAGGDLALGEGPDALGPSAGADRRQPPASLQPPYDDGAGREL